MKSTEESASMFPYRSQPYGEFRGRNQLTNKHEMADFLLKALKVA